MSTTSRQAPNFQPTERITPISVKPAARCTPTEPALAESPITASSLRTPAVSAASQSASSSSRPTPRPRAASAT